MEKLVYIIWGMRAALVLTFICGMAIGHSALDSGNGWQGLVAVIMLGFSGLTLLRSVGP